MPIIQVMRCTWCDAQTRGPNMNTQANIDAVVNEGGEGYSQAEVQQERDGMASLKAEAAAFAAEWTVEVLTARRAAWNAEMQALIAAKKPATANTIVPIVKRLGYGVAQIQRAKALHGIA